MDTDEFSPHAWVNHAIHLWWLVALVTFLGGAAGYIFYHLRGPVYEATATFFVTLDQEKIPIQGVREDLIQYNEDMALNTTEGALLSTEVRENVLAELQSMGISLTHQALLDNYTIERKHDIWELRFRHRDPQVAQTVVNVWAKIGYQAMLSWQGSGKAPSYVLFQPPVEALQPQEPVLYDRNRVMLAGALIGFIIAVLVTGTIGRKPIRKG